MRGVVSKERIPLEVGSQHTTLCSCHVILSLDHVTLVLNHVTLSLDHVTQEKYAVGWAERKCAQLMELLPQNL